MHLLIVTNLLLALLSWTIVTTAETTQQSSINPDSLTKNLKHPIHNCSNILNDAPFKIATPNYQPKHHTLVHQFLADEQGVSHITQNQYAFLDKLIDEAVKTLPLYQDNLPVDQALHFAQQALDQIDCILLRHGFVYPGRGAVQLLSEGLEPMGYTTFSYLNEIYRQPHNIRRQAFINKRRFGPFYVADCDITAFLYLAIAEVLHYPLQLVDIPNHIFVRWTFNNGDYMNYETMDGLVTDDDYYRRNWQIPQAFLKQGRILHAMTTTEARAYHDAAVAEAYSWQGDYQHMLDFYRRSIEHDSTRPFALHNLASYYLAKAPVAEDSAAQALKYAHLAAKVFPSGDNLDTLACAYAHANDFKQALTILKQVESVGYAPFASDIAGHRQRFEQHQLCDTRAFGRDLTPFRPPTEAKH